MPSPSPPPPPPPASSPPTPSQAAIPPEYIYASPLCASALLAAGTAKYRQPLVIQFLKAFQGGVYVSLGGLFALVVGAAAKEAGGPLWTGIAGAAVFPIGIAMIVLTQVELLTSNMMTVMFSTLKRAHPAWYYPLNMIVCFVGNLAGCLFTAAFLAHYSGVVPQEPLRSYVLEYAYSKAVAPAWGQVFLRALASNWLICTGIYQAAGARDVISKVVGLYLPIAIFVACGFDHAIADMLPIPLAIMLGAPPPLDIGYYISRSMIPALLGNFLGAWFIALPYTLFFLTSYGSGIPSSNSSSSLTKDQSFPTARKLEDPREEERGRTRTLPAVQEDTGEEEEDGREVRRIEFGKGLLRDVRGRWLDGDGRRSRSVSESRSRSRSRVREKGPGEV